MTQNEHYLHDAIILARKAKNWTYPNPRVGCILVKQGKIIGKGYHKKVGGKHAEREALSAATENPHGATAYVTLEPCSHFGRTPPCADGLIEAGIAKVVCCTLDPNEKVQGKGFERLRKHGIEVVNGVLEKEARILNEAFFTFHEKKRPFVALKFSASLDGRIATHTRDSKWITNEQARSYARALRTEYQTILVGINTVIHDDPHLGSRMKGRKDPLRIILDSTLSIPLESNVLRDTNVLIVTTSRADDARKTALQAKNIPLLILTNERIEIPELLHELRKREIISVFVEGGSRVLGSFVDAQIVDKLYAFYAPILIGGTQALPSIGGTGATNIADTLRCTDIKIKKLGDNFLITGHA